MLHDYHLVMLRSAVTHSMGPAPMVSSPTRTLNTNMASQLPVLVDEEGVEGP